MTTFELTNEEYAHLASDLCEPVCDRLTTVGERVAKIIADRMARQREEIAKAIEAVRSEHWQQHLRDHPLADGKSCPADYAKHDAYHHAARIAREVTS